MGIVFDRMDIIDRLCACSRDELRVVAYVLGRLERGRETYGPLDLDLASKRGVDWRRERLEELGDAIVYTAFAAIVEEGP